MNALRLIGRLAMLPVVALREAEKMEGEFINRERHGIDVALKRPAANQFTVAVAAFGRVLLPEVVIFAVKSDVSLSAWFVVPVTRLLRFACHRAVSHLSYESRKTGFSLHCRGSAGNHKS